jgi:hypothetical protein
VLGFCVCVLWVRVDPSHDNEFKKNNGSGYRRFVSVSVRIHKNNNNNFKQMCIKQEREKLRRARHELVMATDRLHMLEERLGETKARTKRQRRPRLFNFKKNIHTLI